MEFFKQNTTIDFMGARKWAALFSLVLFLASVATLSVHGLYFGLDFTGGLQIEVTYKTPADLTLIRHELAAGHYNEPVVQTYGTNRDILISLGLPKDAGNQQLGETQLQQRVHDDIARLLPDGEIQRVDFVGPQLGKELATKGALALLVAILGTMIYILIRFEYRFAVSSALALIHDPVLILGIFSFFHVEFDVNALGALLAVIGYSLNDTIVVFDRVRENFRRVRKGTPAEIMNLSINQTLSRTIMTSGFTFLVVLILFLMGGAMIHSFALAMMIGIAIGTYSSIYVAGALALAMGLNRQDLMPPAKTEVDEMP